MATNLKSKAFKYRVAVGVVLLTCIIMLTLPFSSIIVSKTLTTEDIRLGIAQLIKSDDEDEVSNKERADQLINNYIALINDESKRDKLDDEIHDLVNEETMYMYFGENYTKYKDNDNEVIYESDQKNIDTTTSMVTHYLGQYVVAVEVENILDELKTYLDSNNDSANDLIVEYDTAKLDNASDSELNKIVNKYVSKNSEENIAKCRTLLDEYTEKGRELFNTVQVSNTAVNLMFGKDMFGNSNTSTIPYFIILGIAPVVAFLAVCFDNKRNIKYIVSVVAAILCILDILLFIKSYISYGSVISILLYIIVIPLSFLGAMAHNIEYSAVDDKKLEIDKKVIKNSKEREIIAQRNMANNKKRKKKKK